MKFKNRKVRVGQIRMVSEDVDEEEAGGIPLLAGELYTVLEKDKGAHSAWVVMVNGVCISWREDSMLDDELVSEAK